MDEFSAAYQFRSLVIRRIIPIFIIRVLFDIIIEILARLVCWWAGRRPYLMPKSVAVRVFPVPSGVSEVDTGRQGSCIRKTIERNCGKMRILFRSIDSWARSLGGPWTGGIGSAPEQMSGCCLGGALSWLRDELLWSLVVPHWPFVSPWTVTLVILGLEVPRAHLLGSAALLLSL